MKVKLKHVMLAATLAGCGGQTQVAKSDIPDNPAHQQLGFVRASRSESRPRGSTPTTPTTSKPSPSKPKVTPSKVQVSNSTPTTTVSGNVEQVFGSTCYSLKGTTASGRQAGFGVVAVDPRVIPLGTRLHIEGYGDAVAGDTGSAIKGRIIDVWLPTDRQCINWGRKPVRVRVLG